MPRRQRTIAAVLAAVILAVLAIASGTRAADPPAKPNILLIVADDLGWNDVGWHGSKIKTPRLDALVRAGVELDRHYVQPVCTPTRAALLSGRYPSRFGPQALVPSNLRVLPPNTPTIASLLRGRGYETYLCGKWHLGSRFEWGPNRYGFGHSYGSLTGAADPWTHQYRVGPYAKTWHRDEEMVEEEGNATELLAAQAVKWIEDKREPWFLYVPFTAVHIPIDTPPEYKRLYDGQTFHDEPANDESFKRFAAFVSQLDAKVGQLIDALDRTGQRDETLVVFTSDNGGLERGGNAYISEVAPTPVLSDNKPLRGQKATLYEGGIRVCAFANWPSQLKPGKLAAPMHAVDWCPTLAGVAGVQVVEPLNWDGQDMWPAIAGSALPHQPRTIYWAYNKASALLHDGWKLIEHSPRRIELFNVLSDPSETTDLAASEPQKVAELQKLLATERKSDQTELPADLRGLPK
ncbi:MAG: arylsulfatase [Pirellulaceae bacterium]